MKGIQVCFGFISFIVISDKGLYPEIKDDKVKTILWDDFSNQNPADMSDIMFNLYISKDVDLFSVNEIFVLNKLAIFKLDLSTSQYSFMKK